MLVIGFAAGRIQAVPANLVLVKNISAREADLHESGSSSITSSSYTRPADQWIATDHSRSFCDIVGASDRYGEERE